MARDLTVGVELTAEDRASRVLAAFEGELGKLGDSTESLGGALRRLGVSLEQNVEKKIEANNKVLAAAAKAFKDGRISVQDYERAEAAVAKSNTALRNSLKSTTSVASESSGVFKRAGDALRGAFVVTAGDVARALRAVGTALSSTVRASQEQEDAIKRLSNALGDLGPRAQAVTQALVDQATALQQTTRFGDEAIIAGQAFAASFVKSEEALRSLTQSAVDLSAGLGIELQTAFELLTKASQGQTQSLGRYGLVLDESIPKAEKFAQLQTLIADRFGGRAAADAKTYSGAVAQLGNAWGDLLEVIGDAVTKNSALRQSMVDLTSALQDKGLIQSVSELTTKIVGLGVAVSEFAGGAIGTIAAKIGQVVDGYRQWGAVIAEVKAQLGTFEPEVVKAIARFDGLREGMSSTATVLDTLTGAELRYVNAQGLSADEAQKRRANLASLTSLLGDQAKALDILTTAQERKARIDRESVEAQTALAEAAKLLGITLDQEVNAAIEKQREALETLEQAYRRGEATANDVAKAQAALSAEIDKANGKTKETAAAFDEGSESARNYATSLRSTVGPALDEIAAKAGNASNVIQGVFDRSGRAIEGVVGFSQGGTRAELAGGGSRLVGRVGGTFGSQQRVAGDATYIADPLSGRIERVG